MGLLFLSIIIYLLFSFFLTARIFQKITISRWIILFFLVTVSGNILICELLNFFKLLNHAWLFVGLQSLLCGLGFIILLDSKKKLFTDPLFSLRFELTKLNFIDTSIVVLIGAILIGVFVVGTLSPISNSDSLHTHLPRIYYWIQHGSLESWKAVTATQVAYPINISLQGLWVFLLGKSEMLFFVVTWVALVTATFLVSEIAQLLGATKRGALVSALFMLSFPVVLLQTYSYQGDVFVTSLVLVTIFCVLLFIKNRNRFFLYLSGLSLAVALGSKQTAILFVPIFFLALVILLIKKIVSWNILFRTIGLMVLFFIVFSSLKIIQNQTEKYIDNSYMVNPVFYENMVSVSDELIEEYEIKAIRYLYQSVSVDGLTGNFKTNAETLRTNTFRGLAHLLHLDVENQNYISSSVEGFSFEDHYTISEDTCWFGPLFYPIFIITFFVVVFSKNKTSKTYLVLSILLMILFIIGQVILKSVWGPYRGRHMTIAVLSMTPLIAFLIPKKKFFSGTISVILALCSVYLSTSILLFNGSRPILNQQKLMNFGENYVSTIQPTNLINSQIRSKLEMIIKELMLTAPARATILQGSYLDNLFYQNSFLEKDFGFINQYIYNEDHVYLILDKTLIEYALFGVNRTRELYPVKETSEVANDSYVIVSAEREIDTTGLELRGENDSYQIYYKP